MSRKRRPARPAAPEVRAEDVPAEGTPSPDALRDAVRAALDGQVAVPPADGRPTPPPGRGPSTRPRPGLDAARRRGGGGPKGFRALPRRTGS